MAYFKDPGSKTYFLSEEDIQNGGLVLLPSGYVEISVEEAQALAPPLPPLTTIYKHDIWSRCTDQEAAILDGMLKAQPVKLQRLWNDSLSLQTTDALYPMVYAACVQALGQARADAILAPTE